ncbi:hypothetical protein [Mycobacteroides chelonae]|uniref:hypothetical protein n=1 Tax=Mycobacteroides chelonae TaxID=1774 RepID=UPI0008A86FE6|nr:hypothetical protein [Mycobacteroides chelonae]OHT73348.1 hypothetical protein BKG66_07830 [Mycobacteroides chelonae]OHT75939.1 hypothetical protein BKG67_04880 [Mycobacteroides chelonae]
MSIDGFEYNSGAMADQVRLQQTTSHTLDDIDNRGQQALQTVRPFWDSQGGTAYEDASMIIHQGVQEGKNIVWHQADTTQASHNETVAGDVASSQSILGF